MRQGTSSAISLPRSPCAPTARRLILLLCPSFEPDFPDGVTLLPLPLGPLAVGQSLLAGGFDVRLMDENVTERPMDEIRRMPEPLYVGITCMGGHTVKSGRRLARRVRRLWPRVTIVWGGWNPSMLPELYEHASSADFVDVVVRGRGEATALELARRLERGESLEGLAGVSYRDAGGAVHRNEDAPETDPSHSEILPYHLLADHFDDYITREGMLTYSTSYGCPYRCDFCGIRAQTRVFRAVQNDRVVEHLRTAKEWGFHSVMFFDDNFFTSKRRVKDLAQEMLDADLGVAWHCNARVDELMRWTDDELELLARAGCRTINIGLETGDQETADRIHKDIRIDDILELAQRLRAHRLHFSANFIVGLPGESPESLVASLEFLPRLRAVYPELELRWYMFLPSPGTPLWKTLVEEGTLARPETLADQIRYQAVGLEQPWYYVSPPRDLLREWRAKHKAVSWYFYQAYFAPEPASRLGKSLFRPLRRWCRWRFERRAFRVRLEWRAFFLAFNARRAMRWSRCALLRVQPFFAIRTWAMRARLRRAPAARAPSRRLMLLGER